MSKTYPSYSPPSAVGLAKDQPHDRLAGLIKQTITAVEEETTALKRQDTAQVARFTERKGQALVNLNRQMPADLPTDVVHSVRALTERLRQALIENQRCLQIQIDAVSQVAQMIMKSVEADRSDGTYSRLQVQYGAD